MLLFNIHDVVLLLTAGQYIIFSLLLLLVKKDIDRKLLFLVTFLLVNVLISLDLLMIWSNTIRPIILANIPNLLFVGGIGFWLLGPLLAWYVKQVLYMDFQLKLYDLLHLVPALLYVVFLMFFYYLLPLEEKQEAMIKLDFVRDPFMKATVYIRHLLLIIYGCICLKLMRVYRDQLYDKFANIEVASQRWLLWIIGGFITIALWRLFVQLSSEWINLTISNTLGTASTHITFIFVLSMIVLSERCGKLFSGIKHDTSIRKQSLGYTDEQIRRVVEVMENEKLYLDEKINVEKVAKKLSLPQRTLSKILNQHFNKNFFEYVNSYRIEEAKAILGDDTKQDMTILEVLIASGFTSRSTFHSIFKRNVGLTPSEYRKNMDNNRSP